MTDSTRRIALMLDLQWPYKRHAGIFAGIQRYAEEQGWTSIIDEFAHDTLARVRRSADRYDGIIARANLSLARRSAKAGVPTVNVWPSSPARHALPGVYPDSTATGRLIAEHLLSRGFRTFAALHSHNNIDNELEVAELTRLVREAGFDCAIEYVPQHPSRDPNVWRSASRRIERFMNGWKTPVGVYVGQEVYGRLLVQLVHQRGWKIPGDIAIIAGKNEETLCERPRPSLTSIEIGYERIGYAAAELLDRMMDGKSPPKEPIRIAPRGLVVRESTDFFAVENALVASALSYIAANCHRRIGPNDVARAVGAGTRTLQNLFRSEIDRPIATEIRRVRIERAKRELSNGNRPISEIARNAGFGEVQRLYEIFVREIGIPPGEYRKQHRMGQ
jgi:LacI family transcriptional regulator